MHYKSINSLQDEQHFEISLYYKIITPLENTTIIWYKLINSKSNHTLIVVTPELILSFFFFELLISIEKKELRENQYCFLHLLENSSPILYLLLASHVVSLLACQATDSAITSYCWGKEPGWAAEIRPSQGISSPQRMWERIAWLHDRAQDHLLGRLIYYLCTWTPRIVTFKQNNPQGS